MKILFSSNTYKNGKLFFEFWWGKMCKFAGKFAMIFFPFVISPLWQNDVFLSDKYYFLACIFGFLRSSLSLESVYIYVFYVNLAVTPDPLPVFFLCAVSLALWVFETFLVKAWKRVTLSFHSLTYLENEKTRFQMFLFSSWESRINFLLALIAILTRILKIMLFFPPSQKERPIEH